MFDIGWLELIVIGIVALIVVGPNDLPGMFQTAGRFMGRMRAMARDFQRSMEQAADESGLKEATKGLNDIHDFTRGPSKSARSYAKDLMTSDEDKAKREADEDVAYAAEFDPAPKTEAAAADPAPKPEVAEPEPASEPLPDGAERRD